MALKRDSTHSPEEIIFDANLKEFATRIGIICGLESGGKIPPHEAYARIKQLWKELRDSKRNLDIKPPQDGEQPNTTDDFAA